MVTRTQPCNFRHMSHVHANAPEAFVEKGPALQKWEEYERVQKYNPKMWPGIAHAVMCIHMTLMLRSTPQLNCYRIVLYMVYFHGHETWARG